MKNFFYYYYSHRKAIVLLIVIIISIQLYSINRNSKKPKEYDFTLFQQEISQLNKSTQLNKVVENKRFKRYDSPLIFENKKSINKKTFLIVEINSADTSDFESLPNIGSVYAKRICKYRSLLGGFYSKNQLLEVYGIDSARYNEFKDYITINNQLVNKININSSNTFELNKHPYITYNVAQSIINYRKQHGDFQKLSDLNQLHLIDSLIFRKIAPYLATGDST